MTVSNPKAVSRGYSWLLLSAFFLGGQAFCQTALTPPPSPPPVVAALVLRFEQAEAAIALQLQANGGTTSQLAYWLNHHQGLFQAQQELALQLGLYSESQPEPYVTSVPIPDGASRDLEDFLNDRANLANLRAQIHNSLLQQGTLSLETEEAQYQAQGQAMLQDQDQRTQQLAADADQQPLDLPPPLVIPANATPALQAFLTLRDQLMRAEIVVHNQNLQVDAATRAAAIKAWKDANSNQFEQLQQLAQNLSQTTN